MFVRNESFDSFRRHYPIVTTLVAIHLILFVWMNFLPFGNTIIQYGIGFNLAVAAGEYWRLLTPIFLHLSFMHALFNSFSLVLFGPALEKMLGKVKFVIAYLLTGTLANIATYYIGGLDYNFHLGASGAIFGLFGIYLYMSLNRKDLIDTSNSQLIMTILAISVVMTFVNSNINIFAHIFGLLAGAVIAPIFLRNARPFYSYTVTYHQDDSDVHFNPNRWKKRRLQNKTVQKILWIGFGILVVAGLVYRFL